MATRETAAKFTEYAVLALNMCQATSQSATKTNVVNDIAYPEIKQKSNAFPTTML